MLLDAVIEMNHSVRAPTAFYSFTVLHFYSFYKRFLTFEPIFYIYNIYKKIGSKSEIVYENCKTVKL